LTNFCGSSEDLAPLPAADPRGVGLAAAALPMTLAGLLPAIALVLVFKRDIWLRLATLVVFAAVVALFLGCLATGLAVLGLGSLFGRTGLAIGALLIVLLGKPLSGLNSAPELLPRGWGAFGQLLPPGANAALIVIAATKVERHA
jgi:hypothetical protein